jgi:hypothetical protein
LLEWCAQRANPSGVMAEQFHPYTGEDMSVSPLTWSHATYVIVVQHYLRKFELLQLYGDERRASKAAPAAPGNPGPIPGAAPKGVAPSVIV